MPNSGREQSFATASSKKVAADLFLKCGYEGVTIDKIVELAAVRRAQSTANSTASMGCSFAVSRTCAAS
jgi:hypothetical protein